MDSIQPPATGNFDNDGAVDYVGELTDQLIETVDDCFPDEGLIPLDAGGEDVLMPTIAIISLLCTHCNAPPPETGIVSEWRDRYLRAFDAQIDDLDPAPAFKQERRRVIEQTFDELLRHARAFWDA